MGRFWLSVLIVFMMAITMILFAAAGVAFCWKLIDCRV